MPEKPTPPASNSAADISIPSDLEASAAKIINEEHSILGRIRQRVESSNDQSSEPGEDMDAQLIELRDAIAEAKEEDVASLVEQMHQVSAISQRRGKGKSLPVDPRNPYFGHLRLQELKSGKKRDVLIGKRTLLDDGDGLSIVDWRNAPVSRLYYRYEEGDDYEEEFDDRCLEGQILIRRSTAIAEGKLRRIASPQGTYISSSAGEWKEAASGAKPSLEGGVGKAARVPRGQLGIHENDDGLRSDKHLQEITALIDREQFNLITQPDSGVVLIQGGAGSGKTTVALHRVAYLAFNDSHRFAPSKMIIVVFNEALVEYIRHVLPSLGVEGCTVTTYRQWSQKLLRRLKMEVPSRRTNDTPEVVSRFKKHPLILKMIDALIAENLEDIENSLRERMAGRSGHDKVLEKWKELKNLAPIIRVDRCLGWIRSAPVAPKTKTAAETVLRSASRDLQDIVSLWIEMMGDSKRLQDSISEFASGQFNDTEIASVIRWCTNKAADLSESLGDEGQSGGEDKDADEDEETVRDEKAPVALDGEDDAIFLRLAQALNGGLFVGKRRFEYEHIVIDEAQDLCPLEVRVLLDCASRGKSVTIAGDKAQKMIFDNGFSDWGTLLEDAGLPHVAIQPLKITYRSTRQIMALARNVLGPLHDPSDELIARDGAPVSYYGFGDMGESVAFLADGLRDLMTREPSASVALICRFPQQAHAYYDALRVAEVPRLRLVARQDFSFTPGIDITDVRQVKGLEFDYVVLVDPTDQNYPERTEARHLMHIAATRSAYQLWLLCSGSPSKLIPAELVESGELSGN